VTDDQLALLRADENENVRDGSTSTSTSTLTSTGFGCYLSLIAPFEYEITTSFPIVDYDDVLEIGYGSVVEDGDGDEDEDDVNGEGSFVDPFHWIPHNAT
jgi:hypothetical protein